MRTIADAAGMRVLALRVEALVLMKFVSNFAATCWKRGSQARLQHWGGHQYRRVDRESKRQHWQVGARLHRVVFTEAMFTAHAPLCLARKQLIVQRLVLLGPVKGVPSGRLPSIHMVI